MRKITLFFSALLLALIFSADAQAEYYVWDGKTLSRHRNGDPDQVANVKEWQVRLYRRNFPKAGDNYWGLITGKTITKVMVELKRAQEWERRWDQWCGCPKSELTHMNELGPIAVIEKPNRSKKTRKSDEFVQRILEAKDKLLELKEMYDNINEVLYAEARYKNPYEGIGNTLSEYADNFNDVQQKMARLQEHLNKFKEMNWQTEALLNEVSRDTERHVRTAVSVHSKSFTSVQTQKLLSQIWQVNNGSRLEFLSSNNSLKMNAENMKFSQTFFDGTTLSGKIMLYPKEAVEGCERGAWTDFEMKLSKDGKLLQGSYNGLNFLPPAEDDSPSSMESVNPDGSRHVTVFIKHRPRYNCRTEPNGTTGSFTAKAVSTRQ